MRAERSGCVPGRLGDGYPGYRRVAQSWEGARSASEEQGSSLRFFCGWGSRQGPHSGQRHDANSCKAAEPCDGPSCAPCWAAAARWRRRPGAGGDAGRRRQSPTQACSTLKLLGPLHTNDRSTRAREYAVAARKADDWAGRGRSPPNRRCPPAGDAREGAQLAQQRMRAFWRPPLAEYTFSGTRDLSQSSLQAAGWTGPLMRALPQTVACGAGQTARPACSPSRAPRSCRLAGRVCGSLKARTAPEEPYSSSRSCVTRAQLQPPPCLASSWRQQPCCSSCSSWQASASQQQVGAAAGSR